MKYIISGTNRRGSRTRQISGIVQKLFAARGENIEIIDLADLEFGELHAHDYGSATLPSKVRDAIDKVNKAEGLIVVCPEYNGSMPGALKLFIDYWKYPESFEARPIALIGLGGRFGGMRPVEHLQGVFGFRNAYIFPIRIFLTDIYNVLKEGEIADKRLLQLLETQVDGFTRFVRALQSEQLDANSVLHPKAPAPLT